MKTTHLLTLLGVFCLLDVSYAASTRPSRELKASSSALRNGRRRRLLQALDYDYVEYVDYSSPYPPDYSSPPTYYSSPYPPDYSSPPPYYSPLFPNIDISPAPIDRTCPSASGVSCLALGDPSMDPSGTGASNTGALTLVALDLAQRVYNDCADVI